MKFKSLLNCTVLFFLCQGVGYTKAGPHHFKYRVPEIKLEKAIKLVEAFHSKMILAEPIFIDFAEWVREKDGPYWSIGVRKTSRETGHMFYKVTPQGKVTVHRMVKDG